MSQLQTLDPKAAQFAALTTSIPLKKIASALELLILQECTVPFVTRYRKEHTGGLDEEQLRAIQNSYEEYLETEKRRAYILETIKKMEMLTPKLEKKIITAENLNQLEDLYAPYKSKKKTKGQLATDAGIAPLAQLILKGEDTLLELEKRVDEWTNVQKKYTNWKEICDGAQAILMESFAHDSEIKEELRQDYWRQSTLVASKRKNANEVKDAQKYKDYFEFSQPSKDLKNPKTAHRFLAIRRGMTQKVLKVEVSYPTEQAVQLLRSKFFPKGESLKSYDFLIQTATRAYSTFIHSSLDLEIKSELKKLSDESAIDVFSVNLKNLLLQPYLGPKTVISIDPGIRTGCKTVVVDRTGKLLFDTVIYPHEPRNDIKGSAEIVTRLIEHFDAEYIAIGNGTFGRETLSIIQEHITPVKEDKVKAVLVNEAGASIYSASEVAKKEFPDKDATVRGAVSIGRRFQDPLAELVKIDPKSIGVGQYQHDVNQSKLKKGLTGVVEDCVNFVGVDVNTASPHLLSYISGIGPTLAGNIVKKREELGGFKERNDLLSVGRFTQKIFEQAAGFLKVYDGKNPLDQTFIHPERYQAIQAWSDAKKIDLAKLIGNSEEVDKMTNDKDFKTQVGEFTFEDIVKYLKAPGQDPRKEFKTTEFRKDIKNIADLIPDQFYTGIVTNITNFGAFVDIGIKENGLVHISEMADKFVDNPLAVLKVGQEVKARVLEVDLERGRVSLSLKTAEAGARAVRTQSTPSHNSRTKSSSNKNVGKKQDAPLKNNAFASLKNFKVK